MSEPRDSHASDARLVASAKRGDAEAFALLYRRYLDRVYDFVAARVESIDAAQDATQTIFLRALSALPQCRDEEHFAGWLFAIARNVVIDTYRSPRQILVDVDTLPVSWIVPNRRNHSRCGRMKRAHCGRRGTAAWRESSASCSTFACRI